LETKLEKEVKFLKAYAVVATLLFAVFALAAFTLQNRKQKFEEIDVERINIIEKDGQVKIVIANKERIPYPGNIVKGEFHPNQNPKLPGFKFYNEKGDECGGMRFGSMEKDGKYAAGAGFHYDKYNGDQLIGLDYQDNNGNRTVGFNIWDQPDVSIEEQKKNFQEGRKLENGPARDAIMRQAAANQRVFIGRTSDRRASITLSDGNSRPRLRLSVGADGEAKLEFLDASGKVTQSLPSPPNTANK
jgi:hypothetical protein